MAFVSVLQSNLAILGRHQLTEHSVSYTIY